MPLLSCSFEHLWVRSNVCVYTGQHKVILFKLLSAKSFFENWGKATILKEKENPTLGSLLEEGSTKKMSWEL